MRLGMRADSRAKWGEKCWRAHLIGKRVDVRVDVLAHPFTCLEITPSVVDVSRDERRLPRPAAIAHYR